MLDSSTAPTTPEGSMSFSPVLRPFRAADSLDDDAAGSGSGVSSRPIGSSGGRLLPTMLLSPQIPTVRTICCVGAGYVGTSLVPLSASQSLLLTSVCILAANPFFPSSPGGPTAAVLAFQNPHIRVAVVDRDPGRIRRWNSRHPPIYEPGLGDIVRIARDGSRECTFVNVPSPAAEGAGVVADAGAGANATISVSPREPNLFFSTEVSRWIGEADIVLIAVNTPTKSRGAGAGSATDMTAFEAVTGEVAKHARPGAIIVEKSTVPCRTAQLVHETVCWGHSSSSLVIHFFC